MPETTHCCQQKKGSRLKINKLLLVSLVILTLTLSSYLFPVLLPWREIFFKYLKSIWWAVALGLLLGGLIDHYVPREYISKILSRKSPATILNAVFLGFLMSACSHGILALSIQLHKKGASNPAVVSFLLASPWANLAVSMMLISLFGVKGILIVLAAMVIAVNTGFIFMFLEQRGLIESNRNTLEVSPSYSIRQDLCRRFKAYKLDQATLKRDIRGVVKGLIMLSQMVLWWILLGMLLASLAGAFIPQHFFHKFMNATFAGLIVTLILATVIEVCSEGSSPLAFEIYRQSGGLGNSFTFLMAGVVTDYTEIGLLWSNVGKRVALMLPLVTVPQVLFLGWIFNLFIKK